jgi:hypothetical protein
VYTVTWQIDQSLKNYDLLWWIHHILFEHCFVLIRFYVILNLHMYGLSGCPKSPTCEDKMLIYVKVYCISFKAIVIYNKEK